MQYIYDRRYFPNDGASEIEGLVAIWQSSVDFYHTISPDSLYDSQSHRTLVRTLRNFEYGDELFVGFGSSYKFE